MNQTSQKVLEILKNSERVADQVLQNKQEIIELDKRRQSTREAIRDLNKNTESKVWITIGPILVKMEKTKGLDLLKKGESHFEKKEFYEFFFNTNLFGLFLFLDQQTIDIEINKLRSEQKVLVSKLREIECQAPLVGFDLKPLNRNEFNALSANLPGF